MSVGKLVVKQAYGVSKDSKNCLCFSDEHHLCYVGGHHAVVMNYDSKEQQFIQGASHTYDSLGITALASSWPKKVIAVAERANPVAGCTFYDSSSLRRRKVVFYQELGSKYISSVAFSNDGRFFLMQGGAPEWNLTMWNVEKAPKLVAHVKLNSNEDISVDEVSFCPWDSNIIVAVGKGIMKVFRLGEGQLRPHNISLRRDTAHFSSHCWLKSDDRLLVATLQGEILLMENLEFRAIVYPTGAEGEDIVPVTSLTATRNGFVAGTVGGEFRVFEKFEEAKEHYQVENTVYLPSDQGDVQAMAVGYEDNVICITTQQQMFNVFLHNNSGKEDGTTGQNFEPFVTPFHAPNAMGHAGITGMSFALWKPLLATCGCDSTVRLWNLGERRVEMSKQIDADPVGIAIHPSGLSLVVGFVDKLKIYSVLLGKLHETRELPVRQCNLVKFSTGGQMIAAASGSSIIVFDAMTAKQICALRGHQSRIRSIRFTMGDSQIISVGAEGAVLLWDVGKATKIGDGFVSHTPYTSALTHSDMSRAFCVTADKTLKEIPLVKQYDPQTGQDITPDQPREVSLKKPVGPAVFDESRHIAFFGTVEDDMPASVLSLMTMPHVAHNFESLAIHGGAITAMELSPDCTLLVTADENGMLFVSEIEGAGSVKTPAMKMHEGSALFEFQDEVLIHKVDLESKKTKIANLTSKVEELNLNNDHQLRLKEMDHKAKVKEISVKFKTELEAENSQYVEMLDERNRVDVSYKQKINDLMQTHETMLEKVKVKYEDKLNQEEERHRSLRSETQRTHETWNVENAALVSAHQDYLRNLTNEYEEKLRLEQEEQREIQQQKEVVRMDNDDLLAVIDDDASHEVDVMNLNFEAKLQKENEAGVALMAEHAVLKKNLQLLVKDASQQKEDIKRLQDREQRLIETIRSLEKDIISHKKEMREREETVADKEKRIFDLKKKNQELEKFRFVLDYKIKELKLQIAPREAEIMTMRKQIEEMDLELEQYHKSNRALSLMISELKLKLDGLNKENTSQSERQTTNARIMGQIKRDVKETWEIAREPAKLKAKVIQLYRVYVQEETSGKSSGGAEAAQGADPQEVYNRDRESMERNLEGLKRALKMDAVAFKRDLSKMQRENVTLTNDLNNLRRDSRGMQLQKKAIENGYKSGLNTKDAVIDLMELLHMKIPRALVDPEAQKKAAIKAAKEKAAAARASGGSLPAAPSTGRGGTGGTGAGAPPTAPQTDEPEVESMEVLASPMVPHGRHSSPRTAALRTTSAGGQVLEKARAAKKAGGRTPAADHWEAWREIQIQSDQMLGLEEKLKSLCHSLEIDPIQMLSSIDATLNLEAAR